MVKRSAFVIISLVLTCVPGILKGQATGKNLNFSMGNFTNWTGYTWRYSMLQPGINTSPVKGLVSRRHAIMSDTTAYDKNTGNALRKVPKGYRYSARIGDEIISGDVNPRCWNQSLRYTMTIDSSNALLIFRFALVLQYASDHNAINEPRFRLTLYDSKGNVLPDCSNYDVFSSNKAVKGFKNYYPAGSQDPIQWRDWTTVGANLIKYLGQTITIEFMSADCSYRYHYGYAYFVAECQPLYIKVKYCASDTEANLIAPEGFEKYKWTNSAGTTLDTFRVQRVSVPDQKLTYSCTMTSATGCVVGLNTSIVKYIPQADFTSFMIDCNSNTVQFLDLSTTNRGSLNYEWYFEEGGFSDETDPPFTFSTSGMHTVTLILKNPPSACIDTITKNIESFSPPLVGITGDSTYCPGLGTYIKAYGAVDYTWSNGLKTDSIDVRAPGGTFWLIGRSSTGCVSDTIYKTITEEPDWKLTMNGDTTICGSGTVNLAASGAVSYLWYNGVRNDSISTSSQGKYTVTGTNPRGCKKSVTFNVTVYDLPKTEFSFTPDVLDRKNTTLSITIPQADGVHYFWDLGDGSSGSGADYDHDYDTRTTTLFYKVRLTAVDHLGCTDSSFLYIDIVPFIPNVFTPDGDGINDVFMTGFEQEIVDRNGLRIYKGSEGWDGRHRGQPASPDTYFYIVYYRDSKDVLNSRKGYVTLVR